MNEKTTKHADKVEWYPDRWSAAINAIIDLQLAPVIVALAIAARSGRLGLFVSRGTCSRLAAGEWKRIARIPGSRQRANGGHS